ncbi:MAG: hypothetical protein EXS39_07510 [Opitutaceae bacterium]|nr:hypothetical protein [Opitutaceae bacterium]
MQNTPRFCSRLSAVARGVVFVVALLGATTAQAGIKSERLLAAIIQRTPASVLVAEGQQMKQAEQAVAAIPGAEALWGVGDSMEPLYSNHTAVVVAPISFKDLRKGMTVIYLNRSGRMVAHSLTGDVAKGWIAQGVNNDDEDDDLVTRGNLVGVIVQAYSEMHTNFRTALAQQLIAKGKLPAGQT